MSIEELSNLKTRAVSRVLFEKLVYVVCQPLLNLVVGMPARKYSSVLPLIYEWLGALLLTIHSLIVNENGRQKIISIGQVTPVAQITKYLRWVNDLKTFFEDRPTLHKTKQ